MDVSCDDDSEIFDDKNLDQLLREREKLLSLLNDDNKERTSKTIQIDQNETKTVDIDELPLSQNTPKTDDSSLFSFPLPPIVLKSESEGWPTPKKCRLNDNLNNSHLKTPTYLEESPIDNEFDDFNRSFTFDEMSTMATNFAVSSTDDLWDFSTPRRNDYDFETELKLWTSARCCNAADFLRRYAKGALDGREPLFKLKRLRGSRWKCTVFLDRVEYRTSDVKKSKDEASELAALLTLRDVLNVPLSYKAVINNAINENNLANGRTPGSGNDDEFFANTDERCSINNTQQKNHCTTKEYSSDYDDYFMDDEVYKLLDDELENGIVAKPNDDKASQLAEKFKDLSEPPNIKDKIVMKYRGTEYFEVLPDGWIEVTHSSGIPVYLHKTTRVCTLSRPYFLGPGSVRNHEVPLAAVPCLHQKKIKENEMLRQKKLTEENQAESNAIDNPLDKLKMPQVKLQTADDFKNRNLTPDQLHDYCKNSFEFETIQVMRFQSWKDHRAYHRKNKRAQNQHDFVNVAAAQTATSNKPSTAAKSTTPANQSGLGRPMLPSNVKLITVPDLEKGSKPQQKQFFLNPQGKTSIAVLHEYVQKVLKGQVSYEFNETRNAANPYMAKVKILSLDRQRNGVAEGEDLWVEFGCGVGNSKKNAKLNAARAALRVLVPGIDFSDDGLAGVGGKQEEQDDVTDLFDLIPITDSRVHELSVKAGQPTPFVILQECLKRNSAFGNTAIEMKIERIKHQQHEFFMKVGKHEVKVMCTNKKEGKQKAAQFMLEKLLINNNNANTNGNNSSSNPNGQIIKTWGSLIRLYGYGAQRKLQETRKEKDSIIKLQSQSKHQPNEPNTAILDKLRQEMKKLFADGGNNVDGTTTGDNNSTPVVGCSVKSIDI